MGGIEGPVIFSWGREGDEDTNAARGCTGDGPRPLAELGRRYSGIEYGSSFPIEPRATHLNGPADNSKPSYQRKGEE